MRLSLAVAVCALAILPYAAAHAETPEENDRLCSGDSGEAAIAA